MSLKELDIIIAEDIMGWKRGVYFTASDGGPCGVCPADAEVLQTDNVWTTRATGGTYPFLYPGGDHVSFGKGPQAASMPWTPSEDMGRAWMVVEKMAELGYWLQLTSDWGGKNFIATFRRKKDFAGASREWVKSAPEAICIAALDAI